MVRVSERCAGSTGTSFCTGPGDESENTSPNETLEMRNALPSGRRSKAICCDEAADGAVKPGGASIFNRYCPALTTGKRYSPGWTGYKRPASSATACPDRTVAGHAVTPSSASTRAGCPEAASTSVTLTPLTGTPFSLSKITPLRTGMTVTLALATALAPSGRAADTSTLWVGPAERTQSP